MLTTLMNVCKNESKVIPINNQIQQSYPAVVSSHFLQVQKPVNFIQSSYTMLWISYKSLP